MNNFKFQISNFKYPIRKEALFFGFGLGFALCTLLFAPSPVLHMQSKVFAATKKNITQKQTLRISPVIINIELSPGKMLEYEAHVANLSDEPLPIRATFSDFDPATEDGGYIFTDTKKNPLFSWIRMSESNFILPAHAKKTIYLQVKTPRSIPLGGYYGILFFEPIIPPSNKATLVTTRVGMLLLANIGVGNQNAKKAEILQYSLGNFVTSDTILPFLLRVRNTSLNFFTAKPILTIKPLFGQPTKLFLEEKVIFPGKIRRWEQQLILPDLKIGFYQAIIAVSTGNGQQEIQKTFIFLFPIYKALLVLLIVLVFTILVRKRRRLRKAISVLLRDK